MKTGVLERVLTRRYGPAITCQMDGREARCWKPDEWDYDAVLYVGMQWHGRLGTRFASLKEIYGDACGGYLKKNLLKVALLLPRKIYGVWRIDDLHKLPPIRLALELDPSIVFFMDSANVWYYGHKAGELYVFDTQTDELDSLGPIERVLETLMDQWEVA